MSVDSRDSPGAIEPPMLCPPQNPMSGGWGSDMSLSISSPQMRLCSGIASLPRFVITEWIVTFWPVISSGGDSVTRCSSPGATPRVTSLSLERIAGVVDGEQLASADSVRTKEPRTIRRRLGIKTSNKYTAREGGGAGTISQPNPAATAAVTLHSLTLVGRDLLRL
jgi:hypothetical protein